MSKSHILLTKPLTPTSSIRGFVPVWRHARSAFAADRQQSLFTHHKTTREPHLVNASIGHFKKRWPVLLVLWWGQSLIYWGFAWDHNTEGTENNLVEKLHFSVIGVCITWDRQTVSLINSFHIACWRLGTGCNLIQNHLKHETRVYLQSIFTHLNY